MVITSHVAPMSAVQGNPATLQASHASPRIFQLKIRYATSQNGELLSVDYEPHEVEVRGFFGQKKVITTRRAFYRPIMETVRAQLPEGAVVLSDAIDWYNGYIRVFYSIPTPTDQAPTP